MACSEISILTGKQSTKEHEKPHLFKTFSLWHGSSFRGSLDTAEVMKCGDERPSQ
jgi:hypothetical protein